MCRRVSLDCELEDINYEHCDNEVLSIDGYSYFSEYKAKLNTYGTS